MISQADLGWCAAILDFQGHVIRRANGHRAEGSEHISIYVDTSITPITMKLSAMTGTAPEPKEHHNDLKQEWLRRGCGEHCPEAHIHIREVNMPATVKWSVSGSSAAIVLWNLLPHMTTVDQAGGYDTGKEPWGWALGMCFASTRLTGRGAGAAVTAIKRLHSLGWELPPLFRDAVPKELEAAAS
jgi:hypothetical protein